MAKTKKTRTATKPRKRSNGRASGPLKLRKLTVRNFKAIDELVLEFPAPRMLGDPDVLVMGSKNGLGKTSVLESCVLLFASLMVGERLSFIVDGYETPVDLRDLLVRAGADEASVEGEFDQDDGRWSASLSIRRAGPLVASVAQTRFDIASDMKPSDRHEGAARFAASLMGLSSDPLIAPPFMYFHSYRRVQEGSPELGALVNEQRMHRRPEYRPWDSPVSAFKLVLLRSMMSQANLFEPMEDEEEGQESLEKLNELVERFAGGRITKLRPGDDSTVDFRISTGKEGESFTFDGLSSGQKEIISTLFLIWKYTRKKPGIVLIDEPELHLNAEWHEPFVRQLHELAPENQYIIATHSRGVFGSVPPERRVLLGS